MKLYVVRHGDAGDTIEDDPDLDNARPLTAAGAASIRALASWMASNGEIPSCVYAAPEVRTVQTAKILQKAFGLPTVRLEPGLNDDAEHSLRPVVKKIADAGEKRVAIVSHHSAIISGLRALNHMSVPEIDPYAKGELRVLDVARKSGKWDEKQIVRPSDLGYPDEY